MQNRIDEYRAAQCLSYRDLAKKLHCAASTIQRIAAGDNPLTPAWAQKIARVLQVNWLDLYDPSDNPWHLHENERHLVEQYRQLDAANQNRVQEIVRVFTANKF
jgi:ribosome-binding protein aMBF1 (putative translation factor)